MALLQSQVNNQGTPGHQYHQDQYHQGQQQSYPPFQYGGASGRGYYPNYQAGRGRGRGGHYGNRGRDNHFRQRNHALYCWTHGGCGHIGSSCNAKLKGHQDVATFTNKMGGSANNCSWQFGFEDTKVVSHNLNTVTDKPSSSPNLPPPTTIIAKADSGASSHYFMAQDQHVLANLNPTPLGPLVTLPPDGTDIQATSILIQSHQTSPCLSRNYQFLFDINWPRDVVIEFQFNRKKASAKFAYL
jgi:hypothetical protein